MAAFISVDKAKVSKLKRLRFLPRFGFTVDVAGYKITYKQAPILETIYNVAFNKKAPYRGLVSVSIQQCKEI